MVKVISLILAVTIFSGCGVVYSDVKNAYVTAKVVYQDAKYVLHEIQDERENLKKEFADGD